ncbi:precorrin-6y C5,15-methyltransferase (decarboxylating) subunit CbiE [Marinomonas sp.]|nr:precorrin-6y C5,15-methyltransferase (decarboxylating) subunit CbiE [Marinomonas sp.]MDB4837266.1 precorrin-6y C5,15-methyltransferase (decarboxylating) subunit CbiE [Marinomonas sp.]
MSISIHVIGLGVNEEANLDSSARGVLASLSGQDIVLGSPRQHETISAYVHKAQNRELPKLTLLKNEFDHWQSQGVMTVVVLASGDPLYYGIGAWLTRQFSLSTLHFYPNISSLQVACHRLGLSLQNVKTVSLHGRPLSSLRRHLQANKTLALLTDPFSQPKHIAQECVAAGLDQSEIIVCETLGYDTEQVRHFLAKELQRCGEIFDPLNVVIVKTSRQKSIYPNAPGIPDTSFITDKGDGRGMITKREVRLAILSLMDIQHGDLVWDIGAGCGGVSVELAYWNAASQVVAIEHHPERIECLKANQDRFGVVQNLSAIGGRAPEVLVDLAPHQRTPNKVFIGGSDGELYALMSFVWNLLPLNGSLLVSAVTEDTKYQIIRFAQERELTEDCDEQSVQLAISKGERLAGQRLHRPNLPVTLFHFTKIREMNNNKGTLE